MVELLHLLIQIILLLCQIIQLVLHLRGVRLVLRVLIQRLLGILQVAQLFPQVIRLRLRCIGGGLLKIGMLRDQLFKVLLKLPLLGQEFRVVLIFRQRVGEAPLLRGDAFELVGEGLILRLDAHIAPGCRVSDARR